MLLCVSPSLSTVLFVLLCPSSFYIPAPPQASTMHTKTQNLKFSTHHIISHVYKSNKIMTMGLHRKTQDEGSTKWVYQSLWSFSWEFVGDVTLGNTAVKGGAWLVGTAGQVCTCRPSLNISLLKCTCCGNIVLVGVLMFCKGRFCRGAVFRFKLMVRINFGLMVFSSVSLLESINPFASSGSSDLKENLLGKFTFFPTTLADVALQSTCECERDPGKILIKLRLVGSPFFKKLKQTHCGQNLRLTKDEINNIRKNPMNTANQGHHGRDSVDVDEVSEKRDSHLFPFLWKPLRQTHCRS